MNNKEPKPLTKKDMIYGAVVGTIIIAAITLFVLLAFESKLSRSVVEVLNWLIPVFLLLGGGVLVLTYFIDKGLKKKSFLIGGIIICIAAIVIIVLKLTGIIVT